MCIYFVVFTVCFWRVTFFSLLFYSLAALTSLVVSFVSLLLFLCVPLSTLYTAGVLATTTTTAAMAAAAVTAVAAVTMKAAGRDPFNITHKRTD